MTTNIPEIILLCQDADFLTAFDEAMHNYWPQFDPGQIKITKLNYRLNMLPPSVKFDLVVSPANSYGRLDGAFDHAISMTFCPRDDYHALTRATQTVLYDKWRGFAPPGSCTLVEFPEDLKQNPFGCHWVAICPTMREPENVSWDRELVYECVWSLLCQVEGHNRHISEHKKIRSMLMVPFAAGIGKVSKARWAGQTVLAMKHFVDALENPQVWGSLQWDTIEKIDNEVRVTWDEGQQAD